MLFDSTFLWYIVTVVNVIERMVDWSLISNVWNQNRNDAYLSRDGWTARYWKSCLNKLHIVNHFCMVTIIGQIKPRGSWRTRTTRFIERVERVLLPSREQSEPGQVGVYREMLCDIAKVVWTIFSSTRCHIRQSGYTGRDPWKQHCDDS